MRTGTEAGRAEKGKTTRLSISARTLRGRRAARPLSLFHSHTLSHSHSQAPTAIFWPGHGRTGEARDRRGGGRGRAGQAEPSRLSPAPRARGRSVPGRR